MIICTSIYINLTFFYIDVIFEMCILKIKFVY